MFNDLLDKSKLTGGHSITHCELYNAGRSVVSIFGSGKSTTFEPLEISNNRIHDGSILSNDGGLFNSYGVTLGTPENRSQIYNNLFWDQWGAFWGGLVYPDNYTYNLDAHHNVIWYSASNTYGMSDRKFWKTNPPNDCTYKYNTQKNNYANGVKGLRVTDYPGGYFETGASFSVNSTDCGLTTSMTEVGVRESNFSAYPNPASQTAVISYSLPKTSNVQILVNDLLGNEVWCTANRKQEIGEHQFSLDLKNFKNGLYFVRMRMNEQQLSEKLIVSN
jgi:hypothetical protein